ncbi:hypothetical protein BKA70DRAFT_1426721 [Coprinopsis sp. MPI-PUGE-AT-0042]|nr:hypothetical protein BKA70DRAFT_1426721 [Coprinopsis sp. MPI-PUGE-AT-0042]
MATTGNNQLPDTPTAGNTDHPTPGGSSLATPKPRKASSRMEPATVPSDDTCGNRGTPRAMHGLGLEDKNTGQPLGHERDHHPYPYDWVPHAASTTRRHVALSTASRQSNSSRILEYLEDLKAQGKSGDYIMAEMERLRGKPRQSRPPSAARMRNDSHPPGTPQVIQPEPVYEQAMQTLNNPVRQDGELIDDYNRRRAATERQRSTPARDPAKLDPLSTNTTASPSRRREEDDDRSHIVDDRDSDNDSVEETASTIHPKQEPFSSNNAWKGKGRAEENEAPTHSIPATLQHTQCQNSDQGTVSMSMTDTVPVAKYASEDLSGRSRTPHGEREQVDETRSRSATTRTGAEQLT